MEDLVEEAELLMFTMRDLNFLRGGKNNTPFERWEDTFCTNINGNNHKPMHILLCSLTSTLGEEIKFSTEGKKKV